MAVDALLTLAGTPDFDAMLYEPFHHIRRLALDAAQTVEHEHQQDVEIISFSFGFEFLDGVAFARRHLGAGDALFGFFQHHAPAMLGAEFAAFDFLHGDVVMVYLSFGRYAVGESRARRIGRQLCHLPCKKFIVQPHFIGLRDGDHFSILIGIFHCPVLLVMQICPQFRSVSSVVKVLCGGLFLSADTTIS